ncbi:cyclopropane-fatty-acyl-phospholipid synthase family protein [Streptomycetaceae bacterium NBC_01309]
MTTAVRDARHRGPLRPVGPPPAPPRAPVRERLMEAFFRAAVAPLPIRVALPGGERLGRGGPDAPVMRVVRPEVFFRRMGVVGPVGFGEAYMAGDWTSTDLAGLLTPFAARLNKPVNRPLARARRLVDHPRPAAERNTVAAAAGNVSHHYDLPPEFFSLFLDESMTYSSAWYGPEGADELRAGELPAGELRAGEPDADELHAAQRRKIDTVLDRAGVGPGVRMLEIGSGWGALATAAALRGADVTTVTLSGEQAAATRRRFDAAGVGGRARAETRDYRTVTGRYDAVVSVEMIEAVGAEYWAEYFAALGRLTAPGGRIVLQAITMPHDRMLATKDLHSWIQKYIFPGGQIPSLRAVEEHVARTGTLRVTDRRSLGADYARTLRDWRRRFLANADQVAALGFDEPFRRMWEFYLAYAEAGFRSAYLDCWQLRLDRVP